MANAKATMSALVLLSVILLAACKPQVRQVPQEFPSAWDIEAYSEGTTFEDRIAWVRAENGHPRERLFLDTRAPVGGLDREPRPVLRMSKPYGCEVDAIDVAVDKQLFEVVIWDHYTDLILSPALDAALDTENHPDGEFLGDTWNSAPFWQAFRSGEKIALKLSWECDYPEALPAQNGTLATFSLAGADYALYYVTGDLS